MLESHCQQALLLSFSLIFYMCLAQNAEELLPFKKQVDAIYLLVVAINSFVGRAD